MLTTTGLCGRAMLLSSLLAHPIEAEQLWQVRDDYFADHWGRSTPEAQRGLALMRESASAREDVAKLAADFDRLFGGPTPRVVPRESTYRSDITAQTLEVVYLTAGVSLTMDQPADHIATELAFVAQLPISSATPARTLAEFTREHLRTWAPVCLAEISMRAGSLLYQGVGALAMDYIESLPTHMD